MRDSTRGRVGVGEAVLRAEMQAALTRLLPLGLEGVAGAQVDAALRVLERRTVLMDGLVVREGAAPAGLRLLAATARTHARSVNEGRCRACAQDAVGRRASAAWPCSVWQAAELLGLVGESVRPPWAG